MLAKNSLRVFIQLVTNMNKFDILISFDPVVSKPTTYMIKSEFENTNCLNAVSVVASLVELMLHF